MSDTQDKSSPGAIEFDQTVRVRFVVNGRKVACEVAPRDTLLDCLRTQLELTGTHAGCEMGACGACLVQLDGRAVHACLMFAVQADCHRIDTIEGLSESGAIADLQAEFHRRNALQCGFCTAGMLINAHELLSQMERPSRAAIRDALSGNYCRCTGYEAIVDAIAAVAEARAAAASGQQEGALP
jgi:carbon-monoxide dehydrogenase small subunit